MALYLHPAAHGGRLAITGPVHITVLRYPHDAGGAKARADLLFGFQVFGRPLNNQNGQLGFVGITRGDVRLSVAPGTVNWRRDDKGNIQLVLGLLNGTRLLIREVPGHPIDPDFFHRVEDFGLVSRAKAYEAPPA